MPRPTWANLAAGLAPASAPIVQSLAMFLLGSGCAGSFRRGSAGRRTAVLTRTTRRIGCWQLAEPMNWRNVDMSVPELRTPRGNCRCKTLARHRLGSGRDEKSLPRPPVGTRRADLSGRSAIAGFHPHGSGRAPLRHPAPLEGPTVIQPLHARLDESPVSGAEVRSANGRTAPSSAWISGCVAAAL